MGVRYRLELVIVVLVVEAAMIGQPHSRAFMEKLTISAISNHRFAFRTVEAIYKASQTAYPARDLASAHQTTCTLPSGRNQRLSKPASLGKRIGTA